MKIKNKIYGLLSLMIICSFVLSACGSKKEISGKYTASEVMERVAGSITDLPEMKTVKSGDDNAKDIFSYLSDIDYDKVNDFEYRYSANATAEEIAIIRMKDEADMGKIKDDLQKRLDDRKNNFEIYNTDELVKFDGAFVLVKNNYAVLIIGNQAQNGKYEFNKMFSE